MNSFLSPHSTCLLVIDAQVGFREEKYWGPPANPEVQQNISKLVQFFAVKQGRIAVVKHNSTNSESPLFPGALGNALESFLAGVEDVLIQKETNSAFYGDPDLHKWLQSNGVNSVVICGITTNFCCETTARMAGNLGYQVHFVLDATSAFDGRSLDGTTISGAQIMEISAANLSGEFADVHASTDGFLKMLEATWRG